MKYILVKWLHEHMGEPVAIYSEIDSLLWETRKVEVFRNGAMGFASKTSSAHSTRLTEIRMPAVVDINLDRQFIACEVSASEFNDVWAKATLKGTRS
jgi:hypothetical protein